MVFAQLFSWTQKEKVGLLKEQKHLFSVRVKKKIGKGSNGSLLFTRRGVTEHSRTKPPVKNLQRKGGRNER